MKIIDAYTRWETVGIASKGSGVSRISVGRIYNLIRQRLLDFSIYQSDEVYRNIRYDMENDDEEMQRWYNEDDYRAKLARMLGRYRGIDPAHYHLYEAEAVFRVTTPDATQGDLKILIMESIKKGGPLSEKPSPDKMFEVYMDRFIEPRIDKAFAMARKLFAQSEENRGRDPVVSDEDLEAIYASRVKSEQGWIARNQRNADSEN